MKPICALLATTLVVCLPVAGHAQSRHGGGGGRSGPSSSDSGGWRGSSSDSAAPSSSDTSSRWSGSARSGSPQAAPTSGGGFRSAPDGGSRGGPGYRGYGRYRYPAYFGALDLGFALGFSLAYPWYYDAAWGYGYYGPGYYAAYAYGPPEPYDDPFARDYGSPPPPSGPDAPPQAARGDDGGGCGAWTWNADASRYDWNAAAGCRSTGEAAR